MSEYDQHQKIGMLEEKLQSKGVKIHDLELRIVDLENALQRISNPVSALQNDAKMDGAELNGHMAVQLSNDANMLKQWANSALHA
jgi:hypothetical protein